MPPVLVTTPLNKYFLNFEKKFRFKVLWGGSENEAARESPPATDFSKHILSTFRWKTP